MFFTRLIASVFLLAVFTFAQTVPIYKTRLLAGDSNDGVPGVATAARTLNLGRLTGDRATGTIYFFGAGRLQKVESNGRISYVAGNGDSHYQFGPVNTAGISPPAGLWYDPGRLYFSRGFPCLVAFVEFGTNTVQTYAGDTSNAGSAAADNNCGSGPDGISHLTQLLKPAGIASIPQRGETYVADQNRIRLIHPINFNDVLLDTFAGSTTAGFAGDGGQAKQALFNNVLALTVDPNRNLYVVDAGNNRIRKIDSNGIVTTFAGNGTAGNTGDGGQATAAQLDNLTTAELAVDPSGSRLYIATGAVVRVIDLNTRIISRFAGSGVNATFVDNVPALQANFGGLRGIWINSANEVFLTDAFFNRVLRIKNGVVSTYAGGNLQRGIDGPAQSLWLAPFFTLPLPGGAVLVSDPAAQRIYTISKEGVATVFAGGGSIVAISSGDGGLATDARMAPGQMARDPAGNVYVSDGLNSPTTNLPSIRRITPSGRIDFVVSPGSVAGLTADPTGHYLYLLPVTQHRVLRYDIETGQTITYAGLGAPGTAGTAGFSGDDGLATAATLNRPFAGVVDALGNLYIVDQNNHRIRKVDTNGIITTYAGNGTTTANTADNGPATATSLNSPGSVTLDNQGNLLITTNGLVQRLDKTTGRLNRIAGFFSDPGSLPLGGDALSTRMSPTSVSAFPNGEILVSEQSNRRLTVLTPNSFTTPTISAALDLYEWGGGQTLSPNGWVELYGFKLSSATRTWQASDFNGNVSPTALNGVQVLFNGVPGVVQAVQADHINAIPKDGLPEGNVTVQVVNAAGQSNIVSMKAAARGPGMQAPSIFADTNGKRYVAAYFASDGAYVGPPSLVSGLTFRRAQSGDKLVLYGIGFGGVAAVTPAGNIAVGLTALPNIQFKIGGKVAIVDYAGLAPGFVGLYQFNITVPSGVSLDGALEVTVDGVPLTQELALGVQ